jgi:hypothetical protein
LGLTTKIAGGRPPTAGQTVGRRRRERAKLGLYLDGQDVPDPWKQPEEAFTACVTVVEVGADRHLPCA